MSRSAASAFGRRSRLHNHLMRGAIVVGLLAAALAIYAGAAAQLDARGIGTGFGFLFQEAGFAIGEAVPLPRPAGTGGWFLVGLLAMSLAGLSMPFLCNGRRARQFRLAGFLALLCAGGIVAFGNVGIVAVEYSPERSFAFALAIGFANTIKISVFGILLATVVGVVVGIASLSTNWLLSTAATVFVETLRNIPMLVQVLFWYLGVLRALPSVRESVDWGGALVLNNRGIYLPGIHATAGTGPLVLALLVGLAAMLATGRIARLAQQATGRRPNWTRAAPAFPLLAIALAWAAFGAPATLSFPELVGFNYTGGIRLSPEFTALLLGLGFYHAAFISEIVRAGLQGVDQGQHDAARSLGLKDGQTLRLIIFPQALRIMFPPVITQYLSLIKDSSLGFAIAYPELVTINNVTINQTGQAIEVLVITLSLFMAFNLIVAFILNRFERRHAWSWA